MSDCPNPESTSEACPNSVCDDKYLDLPKRVRIRILGIEPDGRCLVEFPSGSTGFVIGDGDGFIVSERPCVAIPVLKSYSTDPGTGAILYDAEGDPIEAPIPGWAYVNISSEEGCQNRVAGLPGIPANLHWDGEQFVLKPDAASEVITLDDYPIYNSPCDTYNMVLRVEEVCDPTRGTIQQATVGYQSTPFLPCGMIVPFGGPDEQIPEGWLKCDGSNFSRTEYSCLYDAIGVNYGGAGSNFQVPDLQGKVPVGIRDAAPAIDAIALGDEIGLTSGDSSLGTTFLPDYASVAVDPLFGMTSAAVNAPIPTVFSSMASGTETFDFDFDITVPAGATHVALAGWLLCACNVAEESFTGLMQVGLTPGAAATAGRYITNAIAGVIDVAETTGEIQVNLGSRYDFQVKADGTAFDVDTVVNYNARIYLRATQAMTKYYGYEVFQHGFRFGEADTDTQLLGTNYIIYAGCPAPGGAVE